MSNSLIDGKPADLPLVSVIIPAYNAESFLHHAIESALAQTHRVFEIIVVDDGSSDATSDVAGRYPVTVIKKKNGGPASARNTGIDAATGEWIAFLDHDDTWHPDKTKIQLTYIKDDIGAVCCPKDPSISDVTFDDLFWRNLGGNPSATIIRRDILLTLGRFDDDPALKGVDDYQLWLKFSFHGYKFRTTPNLYNFTPSEGHYGGNHQGMLSAELTNIDKISAYAGIDSAITAKRKRNLRLEYLPSLITSRELDVAREQLRCLGLDAGAIKYWYAFLPEKLIDLKRRIATMRQANGRRDYVKP